MSESGRDRPIVVVGFQRSGTTLLQSLLGAHPRIAAPPEVHFWVRIRVLADYWGDLEDDANLRRVITALLHPPVPLFDGAGFDERRLFERVAAGPRTYPAILRAFMTDFAERHGKARWSEKSPGQTARQSLALVPDAQLIHIVRDPRDVVASSLATPWTEHDPRLVARRWRRFTLGAIATGARLGPDRFLQLRYEDLTRDPDAALRVVCAFLDEDPDPGMLAQPDRRRATIAAVAAPWQQRALEPVTAARSRRGELTRAARAQVAAVVHDVLPPLGYPPASRSAVWAGRGLNLALLPRALPELRRWLATRRARSDPQRQAAMIEAFLAANAAAVASEDPAPARGEPVG